MTTVLVAAVGSAAFALGMLVGYLLGRPRRGRRSSIELRNGDAQSRSRGRHRGR